MKRKKEKAGVAAVCQLRGGNTHPFVGMKGFIPLGGGEERVYREMREAIPVLDAAVGTAAGRVVPGGGILLRLPEGTAADDG